MKSPGPASAVNSRYTLLAYQPTRFRALRFALSAALVRDGVEVQTESFAGLSLSPSHPRYYLRDGIVNGLATLSRGFSQVVGAVDKYFVDGLVNAIAAFIKRLMSPV